MLVLSQLSNEITDDGDLKLASAIAPPVAAGDVDDLLYTAKRLERQGDVQAARALAMQASRIALTAKHDPAQPLWKWMDHEALLGRIFDVLVDLGSYEAAITTVQPIDPVSRQQYYAIMVQAEAQHKDLGAIVHTLPGAIKAVMIINPAGNRSEELLSRMARAVIKAGDTAAVRQPLDEIEVALTKAANASGQKPDLVVLAEIQASRGALTDALTTANQTGPLVTKSNGLAGLFAAMMAFDNARTPPTTAQLRTQMQRARQGVPPLVPGPKANALASIASNLAEAGQIGAAIQIESALEFEPRRVLQNPRDTALSAISEAQDRAGDLEASLATALRIDQPLIRWKPLLKLATVSPTP